jgi:diguanylate cyclase (GGDEF)-like protein
VDGQTFHLTVSIGVAAVPLHAQTVIQAIEQADRALYAAKEGGRNRVSAAAVETDKIETNKI